MISHGSISPLDAVLVLGIFGFVALCCAALVLEERDAFDLKGGWLAAFSLGRIAGDLLGLMGLTMEVGLWTRPLRELFLVISLLCLVEFGRTGREMSFRWTPGPWIHPLLLGVVALAYAWGWAGMDLAARVILGTVGALWSARALGSREGEGAGWLRIAAAMLLLMTVVMVVSGLATVYLPVELFRDVGGGALMFTPLKIVHAGAVLGLAGAMWGVLVARQDVLPGTPSWRDFFRTPWPVAGLVLALGGGCLLARSAGILADRDIRRELLERTRGLAAAIETEQVASLRGEVGDDKRRGNQLLFRRLAAMAEAQPDIHCTFLVKEKAGRLIFLASARARRLKWRNDLLPRPGSLFLRHEEDMARLMSEGVERGVGPSDDSRGRWLSPLVPIRERDRGEVVAMLGQDYDASRWEREVARSRIPFLMAGLFVAIGLVGAQAFRLQQERSANRLATSEMRFSQLFDQMLNGFALHELVRDGRGEPWDFRYIEINPSFERLTGLKREDVIGRTLREALPGIEPRWIETYLRVVATGVPELIEHFATPLGRWYRATAYCPSPGQLATVFSDATERIRTQRLLRGIAEASHILLAEEDLHRAIRLAMERLGRAADVHRAYWFERHPHPVTGEPCVSQRCEWSAEGIASQVDSPDLQNMLVSGPVFRRWEAAFVRRMPIQGLVRDSPSPEREVLQSQGVISIVGIPILIGKEYAGFIGFDECRREREWSAAEIDLLAATAATIGAAIERHRAQESTRAAIRRFEAIFETNPMVAIQGVDPLGRVQHWNRASENLYGYSAREAMGERIQDLILPEETHASFAKTLARMVANPSPLGGEEWKVRTRDGREKVVYSAMFPLLRDGCVEEIFCMDVDVTERRQLEDQLRHAQKMEAVGRLAGGVAHDFNNLLVVIGGYADLLLDHTPKGHADRLKIEGIQHAAQRAAALTRQLLLFSRKQIPQTVRFELGRLAEESGEMLRRLLGENIHVEIHRGDSGVAVRGDPNHFSQVFVNLAVNARDAMPKGGEFTIAVSRKTVLKEKDTPFPGVPSGDYVELRVADTGCGMSPEVQAHLFEPFFTTKELGKGTGLGLSIVYGIVRQAGGHILVESHEGKGTVLTILMPVTVGAGEDASRSGEEIPVTGGSERILVVEDNAPVREFILDTLRGAGYGVVGAASAEEALDHMAEEGGRIHLVLTDVVMPGIGGVELARRLRSERHHLRVVLMSGFSDDEAVLRAAEELGCVFIRKPFEVAELRRLLRRLLDGAPMARG